MLTDTVGVGLGFIREALMCNCLEAVEVYCIRCGRRFFDPDGNLYANLCESCGPKK